MSSVATLARRNPLPSTPDSDDLDRAIARATARLRAEQRPDGHFAFDLEADAAIPAEYMLVGHFLGRIDTVREQKCAAYLRRLQEDHGGWPMLARGEMNISASVKAYFALKAAGDPVDAPHMAKARAAILAAGGAVEVNMFTRITLALFGIVPWRAVPVMPIELLHAPAWFPFHIGKISYWARATLVPLMVLMALKPRAANPRAVDIDELFREPPRTVRRWPKGSNQRGGWGEVFGVLDAVLRRIEPLFPARSRRGAIDKAVAFVRERLNGEDGLGAIYPSIANTVMMFHVLGLSERDPDRIVAEAALEKLVSVGAEEAFCQPCLSPVWDSVLSAQALAEVGAEQVPAAEAALDWLLPRQVLELKGDWAWKRPDLPPGGWPFQYANAHYPDLDDTAVVVMAMDRARRRSGTRRFDEAIARGRDWVVGMQSSDGGWGAFDVDNTSFYLNAIPFADHGALLDPPTADLTARCVSMMAQLGATRETCAAMRRGIDWLLADQQAEGSWFGRWGINYIYGTWSALCAFAAAGVGPELPAVRRAVAWLEAIQNPDGGWGEDDRSYAIHYRGYAAASSTASQTAWALFGLMAVGRVDSRAVRRGIDYLRQGQASDGFWPEDIYTGTGFPRVFYLRYNGYPKFFPLWALARYRNLTSGGPLPARLGM